MKSGLSDMKHSDPLIPYFYRFTAQKMKFPTDLVTFTEEILIAKLHFLYSLYGAIKNFKIIYSARVTHIFSGSFIVKIP